MPKRLDKTEIEVGKEILSYCGKCKADSNHIISAAEGNKISKVMCTTCKAQHNYRKPKSLIKEKAASKPKKSAKSASTRKSPKTPVKTWDEFIVDYDLNSAKDYSMQQNYEISCVIRNPVFGIGVVIKKIDQTKIEVQFETGVKILIINRK